MQITKPLRISPSSITTFFRCSMQFKYSVLDEIEPDPGSDNLYAVLGSTMHKCFELNEKYDVSPKELKNTWRVLFLNYLSEARYMRDDEPYQYFMSRGFDLLGNIFVMRERWEDKAKVQKIEKYCRFRYENKFIDTVYLSGKIDVILKNFENEIYTALDWKSSKKPKTQKEVDKDLQLSCYIYFIHLLYNVEYENIFGVLAYPSTKRMVFTQRSSDDIKRILFDTIDLMLERISKNDFKKEPKINRDKNGCIFCPFVRSCDRL